MAEEKDNVVMLIDDEGNEVEFTHLDTFEMDDNVYVVLLDMSNDDEDEVVILKVEEDDEGNEGLFSVESDDELDMAFEEFKRRMDEDMLLDDEDEDDYEDEDFEDEE